jgi:hypothetical protein
MIASQRGPLDERPVLFVGAEAYAQAVFSRLHPLAFSRAGAVEAVCRAM